MDVSATAGVSGLQFMSLSTTDSAKLQKHRNNEINLTNTKLLDNGTRILLAVLAKKR
ncbi:hypothetical protein [Bartonella quintana]|uniref:hypothetical protein n=1 Tax=Bartonella quintana TaxID=803 RepID=UPI0002DEAE16|nr:hypothetical protein [Bartonella quintana]